MGEWTLLRSHLSYKQNRGTKRSTRQCSFQWYHRRPSNSNRATNARQCGADDGIFCLCLGVVGGRRLWISLFWRRSFFGEKILLATDRWVTDRRQIWRGSIPEICPLAQFPKFVLWRALNSRNFYSRHVEFLRAPHMNRHKNSGPKGLLRSLSLPTLRSFSPFFHTSTHRQFHW